MSKALLALSFVALSLSGAWASSIQDDDLIDFELVVLTSDGETWIGASGVKIKYADSKTISSWRREQERGGDRTARAAVEAIGEVVESGPDGVAKLRIPDKRLSLACELDGLVTFETFSTREVKVGRAEIQLQNGSLEIAHRELMESMAPGSRSTLAVQLVDEAGEPIRYKRADLLVIGVPTEESESRGDWEPPFGFYSESYDNYFTDKEGRVEFLFGFTRAGDLEPEIDGGLEGIKNRVVVHLKAGEPMDNFSRSRWSGETLTGVATLEAPHSGKRFDLGRVSLSKPPLLISGRVSDQSGAPLAGVGVVIGDVELASGATWVTPYTTPISFHFTWDGMRPDSDPDARTEFDRYFRTRDDGLFEVRGRLFQDEWGLVPASAQGEVLLVAYPGLGSSRMYESVELNSALGSKDVQVWMGPLPKIKGNVLLPDEFPQVAILIHALKPSGALAGGAMSLDAQGEIQMHSAPQLRIGDPRLWSNASYGGITYDESVPAEIEPGTWDVCFELKGERDWDDPAPFHVIPAVEFSMEGVTEDPRLKDIDFREALNMTVLAVQGSDGKPIPEALVRCKPANSGREWFSRTEAGFCRIATTAKAVDVEVMAPGHRPSFMAIDLDREFEVQLVSLEEGVPVKLSIPDNLEIPLSADAAGERPTKFEITLRDTRYEIRRARDGRDESPYGRRHPDKGFGGEGINYIGTAASGGGMVIPKDLALRFSGYYSEESFLCAERELTMFVPQEGRYEVKWVMKWQEPWVEDGPNSRRSTTTQRLITTTEVDIQEGQNPSTAELDVTQAYLDARLGEIRKER
jgi:hypothetical protein